MFEDGADPDLHGRFRLADHPVWSSKAASDHEIAEVKRALAWKLRDNYEAKCTEAGVRPFEVAAAAARCVMFVPGKGGYRRPSEVFEGW